MTQKVRISIANLVTQIRDKETGKIHFLGMLNPKAFAAGRRLFTAIGGAAELTDKGRERLGREFGASEFDGRDARFVVGDDKTASVLELFSKKWGLAYCEQDPTREILEELSKKELPILEAPALTQEEAAGLKAEYLFIYIQPEPEGGKGTSARESEIPTRRIFFCFEIIATKPIIEKLAVCPAVKFFTQEELATTNGGARQGIAADGSAIGDNLFLQGFPHEKDGFGGSEKKEHPAVSRAEEEIKYLRESVNRLEQLGSRFGKDLAAPLRDAVEKELAAAQEELRVALQKRETAKIYHIRVPQNWLLYDDERAAGSYHEHWIWCWDHQRYCRCSGYYPRIYIEYEGETKKKIGDLLLVDWKIIY